MSSINMKAKKMNALLQYDERTAKGPLLSSFKGLSPRVQTSHTKICSENDLFYP
ncbi:MAG: hypothetical protein EXX96DRAFT_609403, partial [Benjaminiella poitrasii]